MDLTKTVELFEELRLKIAGHRPYLSGNETVTRVLLVDPVLEMLGWDVRNADLVALEYRTAEETTERADYLLKTHGTTVAVVEAKKLGTSITSREKRQVKEYADYADVSWCALTDGARWMVYDLNEGRNPETMQPKVELDVVNDEPQQLALNCLILWQPNLSSPSGPIVAESPVLGTGIVQGFKTGPDVVTDPQGYDPVKVSTGKPKQSSADLRTTDQDRGIGWTPITDVSFSPTKKRAVEVQFGGNRFEPKDFTAAFVEIATRLVRDGLLTSADCPIRSTEKGGKFAIATTPFHENGNEFRAEKSLPNGLFLEASYSNKDKMAILRKLVVVGGVNPQAVSIRWESQ